MKNELAQIVPVNTENPEQITVSARDLHIALEVETRFNDWFSRMCEYGFEEGKDFYSFLSKTQTGGRPSKDAELTIEMAKEICMLQRTEKGKLARQYFIQLEKAWNSPEQVMARALQIANDRVAKLQEQIEQDAPAVRFANAITSSDTNILVRELAKILTQNGFPIGGNRLFELLRNDGYLIKTGSDYNLPTQKAAELGLFFIKESPRISKDGAVIDRTVMVTPKAQKYFINKYAPKQALN